MDSLCVYKSYILLTIVFIGAYCKTSYKQFYEEAQNNYTDIINMRRHLHQYPELRFKEFETSKFIQNILQENNITFTTGWGVNTIYPTDDAGTGILAQVGTGKPPCVAIRADMDALPITELLDFPFKSKNEGVMHACGHDAHVTMLLESAILLKKHEDEINGTVKFIFQPAEESGGGAHMMVNEGILKQYPPIERVAGLHVGQNFPSGVIATRPGTLQSASYNFRVFVYGKGGHAAQHHQAIDPLAATAAIVRALYDMYARERYFQYEEAGLITITYIDAGSATNVISDHAEFGGTMRAVTKQTIEKMVTRFNKIVETVATAHRCTTEIVPYKPAYPPNVIDKYLFEFIKKTVNDIGIEFQEIEPTMGAEDFAYFAEAVPSVFFRLGTGSGGELEGHPQTNIATHNARFALDERVLPQGAAFHSYFAMESLDDLNQKMCSGSSSKL